MRERSSTRPERTRVRAIVLIVGLGGAGLPGMLGGVALGCNREEKRAASAATLDERRPNAETASPTGAGAVKPDADIAPADTDRAHAATAASASATASEGVAPVATQSDPSNRTRPSLTSEDLAQRAAHLLDAIAKNDPATADDFFFPKAPFVPLKDVGDPARYFDQLRATYHRDIGALHAERKDWTGVAFASFELGTTPTWVAPGKEYNKIGYFRTFGGKLRYRIGEKVKELAVSTIISWDGRWYVTHLSPIRH